jgi:hypothetical protein
LICEPPLQWVSPSALSADAPQPPDGHFILRVSTFHSGASLVVTQGDRTLWQRRYRHMVPNIPVHASAGWVQRVDWDADAVTLRLEGMPRPSHPAAD